MAGDRKAAIPQRMATYIGAGCGNSRTPARTVPGARARTKERTMCSRKGGHTASPNKYATRTDIMQELAFAGPSAIESFGPEPGGPPVRVEMSGPDGKPFTFMLRCGLFAAGGDRE
jgi:hypothetical protein